MPEIRKYQWGGNALFNNPLFANLPFANMVGPTGNSSDGKANPLAGIQSFLGFTPSSNMDSVQETSGASGNLVSQDQGIVQAAVPGQASLAGGGIGSIINAGKNFKSLAGAMKDAKAAGEGLKGLRTNIAGNAIGMVGNVLDMASSFIPGLEDQYAGPKGDITQTVDSVYDNVSNTIMAIPGVGAIAGGAMKIGGFVGDILDSQGIGTDKMTTKDAILDSNFLKLTPFGLINALGAKKTTTLTKDNEAFEQVGSSYGGTSQEVDDALKKAGKKYGLFSSKERREAESEISEARRQQMQMAAIADNAADRFAITDSMAAINNNRRALALQGGYNQAAVRVGRSGMSLDLIAKTKKILSEPRKLQTGGTAKDPFEYYVSTLPVAQRDSSDFRVRDYWQYNGQPKDFDEAKKRGMFSFNQKDNSYHARSVAENPQTGDIEFMKSSNHPTIFMETDWYEKGLIHNDDGTTVQLRPGIEGYENWQDFKNNYELQRTEPYWKYVRRKKDTPSHKEGGQMQVKATEILIVEPELIEDRVDSFKDGGSINVIPTEIELVSLDDIQEYKEGGSINVIPEGALHARLHHMDMDGITKKGIPVVDNNGVQQAEIEHSEIIFRIEVTKKLEELQKKYYSENYSDKEKNEFALEAGQLLVDEVLHNTDDRTNLINQVE